MCLLETIEEKRMRIDLNTEAARKKAPGRD